MKFALFMNGGRRGHAMDAMIGNSVAVAVVASRKKRGANERGRPTDLTLLNFPLLACHSPNEIRVRASDTHGTDFTADGKQRSTKNRPWPHFVIVA